MPKILTVTSGKGGVGKTNISVNLAIHLTRKGFKTCLFDADLGLANINILLGIYPEFTLEDVINGEKTLNEIIVRDRTGIDIIPGSSGVAKMTDLPISRLNSLAEAFSELDVYDYFIFDTSAGLSKSVAAFCMSASEVILVISPEPTSLTDAYALIKVLSFNGFTQTAKVIVNQSKTSKHARIAFNKLKNTVRKYLGVQLAPLGTILADSRVTEAVGEQQPFITRYPDTPASKCLMAITDRLLGEEYPPEKVFPLDTFWNRFAGIFTKPMKMPVKKYENQEINKKAAPHAVTATSAAAALQATEEAPEIPPKENSSVHDMKQQPSAQDEQLMGQLIGQISSISRELSEIRKVLERIAGADRFGHIAPSVDKEQQPHIQLDFETFLKSHPNKG